MEPAYYIFYRVKIFLSQPLFDAILQFFNVENFITRPSAKFSSKGARLATSSIFRFFILPILVYFDLAVKYPTFIAYMVDLLGMSVRKCK